MKTNIRTLKQSEQIIQPHYFINRRIMRFKDHCESIWIGSVRYAH